MKFLRSVKLALFALCSIATSAPYSVSVYVMEGPKKNRAALIGDLHLETEDLLEAEQEVLDFIKGAIDTDTPLDLIWEKREGEPIEYQGRKLSYGKRAKTGEIFLLPTGLNAKVSKTLGLLEIAKQTITQLDQKVQSNVHFYCSDPRIKSRFIINNEDISIDLLAESCSDLKTDITNFEIKAGILGPLEQSKNLTDRVSELLWKINFLQWKAPVIQFLEDIQTFKNNPQEWSHIIENKQALINLNDHLDLVFAMQFMDHSVIQQIIKINNPAIIYAGDKHCQAIWQQLNSFGYSMIGQIQITNQDRSPISEHQIKEALKTLLEPPSIFTKMKNWTTPINSFVKNQMEKYGAKTPDELVDKLEQQYRTLVAEQELE